MTNKQLYNLVFENFVQAKRELIREGYRKGNLDEVDFNEVFNKTKTIMQEKKIQSLQRENKMLKSKLQKEALVGGQGGKGSSGKSKGWVDCNNPKGFSQKAHCDARKKRQRGGETKSKLINENVGEISRIVNQYMKDTEYDILNSLGNCSFFTRDVINWAKNNGIKADYVFMPMPEEYRKANNITDEKWEDHIVPMINGIIIDFTYTPQGVSKFIRTKNTIPPIFFKYSDNLFKPNGVYGKFGYTKPEINTEYGKPKNINSFDVVAPNKKKEKLNEKTDFSKEKSKGLHGWFERQGGSGSYRMIDTGFRKIGKFFGNPDDTLTDVAMQLNKKADDYRILLQYISDGTLNSDAKIARAISFVDALERKVGDGDEFQRALPKGIMKIGSNKDPESGIFENFKSKKRRRMY